MKRIIAFFIASLLLTTSPMRGQTPDAAAAIADKQAEEERYKRLNSLLEDLQTAFQASQVKQASRVEELVKRIASLEDHQLKQSGNTYASAEDVKKLAEAIREVDAKRIEDGKKTTEELAKLLKAADAAKNKPTLVVKPSPAATNGPVEVKGDVNQKGYEYVVQDKDTLIMIAAAYRAQGIKVSVADILKANPGLVAENMRIGQKLFIPHPKE